MSRRGPIIATLWVVLASVSVAQEACNNCPAPSNGYGYSRGYAAGGCYGNGCDSQWFSRFCESVKRDYHRNKMWPEPFLQPDREAVMTPFAIQTANGVRRQNMLSDYHFNEENHQLTLAGETKLRWILTQQPPMRRTVFVQQGLAADVTATRMRAVQRASSRILPAEALADIVETNLPNDGWPAADSDAVSRAWNASRPDPRLRPGGIESAGAGGDTTSIR